MLPTRLRHEVRAPVDAAVVLMPLVRACRDEVEAGSDYLSGSEVRRRRVEPYHLVASGRRRHLLAYDLDCDDWRSCRVDRMTAVSAPDLALPSTRGARCGGLRPNSTISWMIP
ncbi:WYL domain-containing protein [Nonomuraea helvata]|uniref:WYL domain-containing protein n=1 Tax=Nonomuraea helvata TaxID=37484 RepID=A0ABV5S716_9ACTN